MTANVGFPPLQSTYIHSYIGSNSTRPETGRSQEASGSFGGAVSLEYNGAFWNTAFPPVTNNGFVGYLSVATLFRTTDPTAPIRSTLFSIPLMIPPYYTLNSSYTKDWRTQQREFCFPLMASTIGVDLRSFLFANKIYTHPGTGTGLTGNPHNTIWGPWNQENFEFKNLPILATPAGSGQLTIRMNPAYIDALNALGGHYEERAFLLRLTNEVPPWSELELNLQPTVFGNDVGWFGACPHTFGFGPLAGEQANDRLYTDDLTTLLDPANLDILTQDATYNLDPARQGRATGTTIWDNALASFDTFYRFMGFSDVICGHRTATLYASRYYCISSDQLASKDPRPSMYTNLAGGLANRSNSALAIQFAGIESNYSGAERTGVLPGPRSIGTEGSFASSAISESTPGQNGLYTAARYYEPFHNESFMVLEISDELGVPVTPYALSSNYAIPYSFLFTTIYTPPALFNAEVTPTGTTASSRAELGTYPYDATRTDYSGIPGFSAKDSQIRHCAPSSASMHFCKVFGQ